jgi:hypothetical protein
MLKSHWLLVVACVLSLGLAGPPRAEAADPKGFSDILGGIEKGKRFYPLWPPAAQRSIVGVVVSAKKPEAIMATWESIESPTFLSPTAPPKFEIGSVAYAAPELTQDRLISVDIGFAELDALASAGRPQPAAGSPSAPEGKKETGVDLSLFADMKRSVSGIAVEYYTLGTLMRLPDGLNDQGKSFLSKESRGWIVHRCLRLDGLDYTATTKNNIAAGFFAKLVSWLPSVDVRYVNNRTLRLVAKYPVYIGYKLWRPGVDPAGTRGLEDADVQTLGLGAEEIEQEYEAASPGPR